jgi:transposase
MGQRRRFTPEFKRQAVQRLNAGQRPAAELARELGLPRNRLYKWQKDVRKRKGVGSLFLTGKVRFRFISSIWSF